MHDHEVSALSYLYPRLYVVSRIGEPYGRDSTVECCVVYGDVRGLVLRRLRRFFYAMQTRSPRNLLSVGRLHHLQWEPRKQLSLSAIATWNASE